MTRLWRDRDLDAIDELHASGFVDRSPSGRSSDLLAYKQGVADLFAAFPDFVATIDGLVVDEGAGEVAIRWSANGTHQGEFLGAVPTGRRITFRGIEIIRVADDRIVERWGEWDGLDLVEQLGAGSARP
jgi:predicted ester cyclase